MWRNDQWRSLRRRAHALLSKQGGNLRWVWVVGDSQDETHEILIDLAQEHSYLDITIVRRDTGIEGMDPKNRLARLSLTANAYLDQVDGDDDYVLIHESDIESPVDLVPRMLATGLCPLAGWPVLPIPNDERFYDIWAYRKDGKLFRNWPPYHECYRPDEPFEVDSAGTVLLFPAEDVRDGLRCKNRAIVDICAGLRERGRRIWVDPTLRMVQPLETWQPLQVVP